MSFLGRKCSLFYVSLLVSCQGICSTADVAESCGNLAVDANVLEQNENEISFAAHVGLLQLNHITSAKAIETSLEEYNATACLEEVIPLLPAAGANEECEAQCGDLFHDPGQVAAYKQLAANPNVHTICETGFNVGRSSALWLCSKPNVKLYSFDLEFPKASKEVIQKYFGDRFVPIAGDSMETLARFVSDPSAPYCDVMSADGGHYGPLPWSDLNNFANLASRDPERSHRFLVDELYFYRAVGCCMDVTEAHERALHEGMLDTKTGYCQDLYPCYNKVPGDLDFLNDGKPHCDGTERRLQYPLDGSPDQTLNSTYPEGGFCVMSFDKEFLRKLNRTNSLNRTELQDTTDYRADAKSFLERHPAGVPDNLARVRLQKAEDLYKSVLLNPDNQGDPFKARAEMAEKLFDGMPGIITHVPEDLHWPSPDILEAEELSKRTSGLSVAQYTYAYPGSFWYPIDPKNVTVGEYVNLSKADEGYGNDFLFMNAPNEGRIPSAVVQSFAQNHLAILDLAQDTFNPRPLFSFAHEDNEDFLSLDAVGSGHGWHFHAAVWNTQLIGRKIWYTFPNPHPIESNEPFNGLITRNATIQERVTNPCIYLARRTPPVGTVIFAQNPGDTVVLPNNWWHATCALDNWTAMVGTWLGCNSVDGKC